MNKPNDEVFVDLERRTCTCTDFVWRSPLRDMCRHMKAAKLYVDGENGSSDDAKRSAKHELAEFLRRKQRARPRRGRDDLLCSADDDVRIKFCKFVEKAHVYDKMQQVQYYSESPCKLMFSTLPDSFLNLHFSLF